MTTPTLNGPIINYNIPRPETTREAFLDLCRIAINLEILDYEEFTLTSDYIPYQIAPFNIMINWTRTYIED